jgi:hypothetical protein
VINEFLGFKLIVFLLAHILPLDQVETSDQSFGQKTLLLAELKQQVPSIFLQITVNIISNATEKLRNFSQYN